MGEIKSPIVDTLRTLAAGSYDTLRFSNELHDAADVVESYAEFERLARTLGWDDTDSQSAFQYIESLLAP